MPGLWLFKEESTHYSFDDLLRDKRTVWDGVRNNLALKNLRSVKKGDKALFFHTGKERVVVGIMKVVSDPRPDPKLRDERLVVVDVEPLAKLPRPVSLAEIKKNPKFKGWDLLRLPRLSVMPVSQEHWDEIERMAKG